ncbi:MAG TPA: hypothetical protein VHG70_01255 [Nocardioidaceae bacterium]|nr:hypothetical protein [Nocardioidaceae bacterium]
MAVLNRDTRIVKFVLLDDAVLATAHLPAMPFAPRQLRALVSAMAEVVDRVDDDLVARIGGRRGLEPESEEDEPAEDREDQSGERSEEWELHPALLTLIHLDPHGEGVDADLAASVCEYDRDLVLRLLRQAGEQEIEWRESGNLALMGDETDEARVCFGEAHTWEVTLETLRSALRVIAEQQRAESSPARADRGRGRGRARARRRAERPHQPSLVDDAVLRRHSTGEAPLFEEPDS